MTYIASSQWYSNLEAALAELEEVRYIDLQRVGAAFTAGGGGSLPCTIPCKGPLEVLFWGCLAFLVLAVFGFPAVGCRAVLFCSLFACSVGLLLLRRSDCAAVEP